MSQVFADLSTQLADAVERAAASVVQIDGHRRPVAGVVIADNLIAAPARAVSDETVAVRLPGGGTAEGAALGYSTTMGLVVIRVANLGVPPLAAADEPRVGHLAVAVGRTWSGAVMAGVTSVAVIGGPLRTTRTGQIDRVIRIVHPPHGALTGGALVDGQGRGLGLVTSSAIRGTTVVLPSALAWPAAQQVAEHGGTRQGFLGVGSTAVAVPERQRGGAGHAHGLLITAIVAGGPADAAGLLVGDILVSFDGQPVDDPETLVTLLRRDRVGKVAPVGILRGAQAQQVEVTIGERPAPRPRRP